MEPPCATDGSSWLSSILRSNLADMPSFKLAGRLKAAQQIITEEFRWKSWKVWLCLLCEAAWLNVLAFPGLIHFSLYLAVLAIMIIMAWHRAGLLTSPWCHPLHDLKRLKRLSLNLLFPEDYSAFGLAQNQQPARAFVRISALLRSLCILTYFVFMYWFVQAIGQAVNAESDQELSEPRFLQQSMQDKLLGDYEPSTALAAVIMAIMFVILLLQCFSVPFWLIMTRCLCGAREVSGAAVADIALQQRVTSRAQGFSAKMKSCQIQPSIKERALLYVDMATFFLDMGTDINLAVQLFNSQSFVFCGLQVAVICVALLSEVRLLMEKENCCCSGLWKAVSESISYGYPTDTYLAMSLREKSAEAPLSFLLQGFIYVSSFAKSSPLNNEPVPETLSTQVTELSNFASLLLSLTGTVKAAYLNCHLDLASHLDVLEGDQRPMKHAQNDPGTPMQLPASPAQPTLPSPPGMEPCLPSPPGMEQKHWAPIQVGMPRGAIDTE